MFASHHHLKEALRDFTSNWREVSSRQTLVPVISHFRLDLKELQIFPPSFRVSLLTLFLCSCRSQLLILLFLTLTSEAQHFLSMLELIRAHDKIFEQVIYALIVLANLAKFTFNLSQQILNTLQCVCKSCPNNIYKDGLCFFRNI